MFSVVIPIYNKSKYLNKSLSSVVHQSFNEFEIILINDGSTDNSLEIAKIVISQVSDKKCIIIDQPNQGVSTARNNGVAAASFPNIAFLDADDWWHPDYLLNLKKLIDKYPEAGIYGSSYFKVKNKEEISAKIGLQEDFQDGLINYFQVYAKTLWMPLTSSSTIIKKTVFDEFNGFNPQLKLGEDFYLWAHVALNYTVAFLNKPLAYYNQDVDVKTRAVGSRLYEPNEYSIFADIRKLSENKDFQFLFQRLALYGLKKYYLADKNTTEVQHILDTIEWKKHSVRYWLIYKFFPKKIVKAWYNLKMFLYLQLKAIKK